MAGAGPPRPAEQPVRLDSIMAGIATSAKVASRYSIGEKLGKGSFATVRACKHRASGERYALKTIYKDLIAAHKVEAEIRRGALCVGVRVRVRARDRRRAVGDDGDRRRRKRARLKKTHAATTTATKLLQRQRSR